MVIADLNLICLGQNSPEIYQNDEIGCNYWDLKSSKKISYYNDNWHIFKALNGIWYDIYPVERVECDYGYDKEFFDLHYDKNSGNDLINAFNNKKNCLICIECKKQIIIDLIEFYMKKSPIKRICFMCRVQDEEVEAILGTLSKKEFLLKLENGQLKYNIAYIISE